MAEDTVLGAQSQSDDTAAEGGDTAAETQDKTAQDTGNKSGDSSGDTAGAVDEGGDDEGDAAGAPEEYAEFTLPEGVTLDAKLLEAFTPVAKELGLTQEAAQKLVDLQAGTIQAEATARQEAFEATLNEWRTANKADPEFGGAKWEQTKEAAGKLIHRLGTPELKTLLNETGLGDHPEMIRIFHRVAQAISEDTAVNADAAGGEELTPAQRIYGKNPK